VDQQPDASVSERFRRVAAGMTRRVEAVPPERWDSPSPCEGWAARDVVEHLVDWLPGFFFTTWDLPLPSLPSAEEDPVAAWGALRDAFQAALGSPEVAGRQRETPLWSTFAAAVERGVIPDVLIHTWDLARATGLDERLDPAEVHRLADGIPSMPIDAMVGSGQYARPVEVDADADEQSRVLAAFGRRP